MLHAPSDQFAVEPHATPKPVDYSSQGLRDWIGRCCNETGLTPSALARAAGLASSTLTRFLRESGSETLNLTTIQAISAAVKAAIAAPSATLADLAARSPAPQPSALAFFPGLRFVQVPDDHLEPTVHRLDYVLIAPVAGYRGEGYYLVENGLGEPAGFYCSGAGKVGAALIRLRCLNPHYSDEHFSLNDFAKSVVGKIVLTCKVQDPALLRAHLPA